MSREAVARLADELAATNPGGILSRRRAARLIRDALAETPPPSRAMQGGRVPPPGQGGANIQIHVTEPPPRVVYVPVPRRPGPR